MLDPIDIERIAARTAELLRGDGGIGQTVHLAPLNPVIKLAQAIVFVGKRSDSAFYRWCKLTHVRACSAGRYAVSDLRAGMVREAKRP
jgi:hypothetical protein